MIIKDNILKDFEFNISIFETLRDIVFIMDPSGSLRYINNRVKDVLGVSRKEFLNKDFRKIKYFSPSKKKIIE